MWRSHLIMKRNCQVLIAALGMLLATDQYVAQGATSSTPEGWQTASPREELRPRFAFEPKGGADGQGVFVIQTDAREGLDGYWLKSFPVKGGQYYRFSTLRKLKNVESPRRSG